MHLTWNSDQPLNHTGLERRQLLDGRSCCLWAKGYFFDPAGRLYYGSEIVDWLARELSGQPLQTLVPHMNGCFTVVAAFPDQRRVEVGVDRAAAVPIFCHCTPKRLEISDNFWSVAQTLGTVQYDPHGLVGMLLLSHTAGITTMLQGVETFAPAAIHTFKIEDHQITYTRETYWKHAYRPRPAPDYPRLRQEAAAMLRGVFDRYARGIAAHHWTAQIPLSGGLDSRLVAGMLHQSGVPMRIFSYGPSSSLEVSTAEQVAGALCVPFRSVAIDDPNLISPGLIETMTGRVGMNARFTTGLGAQLALPGSFDPNVVYLSGHPANLPTGHATRRGETLLRTERQTIQFLLNNHAVPVLDETARRILPGIWEEGIKFKIYSAGLPFDSSDPIGSFESVENYYHSSNHLLQEMRTYEANGNWLLPYMDYELVDFYNHVPLQHRFGRRLHVDAILNHLFINNLAPLKEIYLAGSEPLRVQPISWRDDILMHTPPSALGDLILRRATSSTQRSWKRSQNQPVTAAWGPDPIDYWWHNAPGFKNRILDTLQSWDGFGGMVDVAAVRETLHQPMHPMFIRFVVASLLTMQEFQRQVETRLPDDGKSPRQP